MPDDTLTIDALLMEKITSFLNEIGIDCREGMLMESTFLPGIDIQKGGIIYDRQRLKYPGDLLHEAGHLAVLRPADRKEAQSPDSVSGDIQPPAAEMAAIAWSWAAAKHLKITPDILFHEGGYKGESAWLIEIFSAGSYIGVPMLQWFGMTKQASPNTPDNEITYPRLAHWLRPE